jgi:hypothetical protein
MGVSVMVAVYTVDPANGLPVGLQDTVPVYSVSVPVTIIGVPPVAGAVTPGIAKWSINGGAAVTGVAMIDIRLNTRARATIIDKNFDFTTFSSPLK